MNFWKIMNLAAWVLSLFLLAVMLNDFFRVEKEKRRSLSGTSVEDRECSAKTDKTGKRG